MGNFRELDVWKLGRELVVDVYQATEAIPSDERFGLISQIQRAAVSIPANIAEGVGRQTDGAFVQFLRVAIGSANELETLLVISADLKKLSASDSERLINSLTTVRVKLHNLVRSVQSVVREEAAIYGPSDN